MPLVKPSWPSGLQKDESPLTAEGGWIDADKIRFVRDRPQTMGGWEAALPDTIPGIVRGAHAWADLSGRRYYAFGTATHLYVVVGGLLVDITPPYAAGTGLNPFTTVSGSPIVTVGHLNHNLATGMVITYTGATAVGGLTLNGAFPVTVTGPNNYTITAGSNATSSASGGGTPAYTVALPPGLVDGIGEPGGYGRGTYSSGGYGDTLATDALPRIWSLANWGEKLLAVPRGGKLYEWTPPVSGVPSVPATIVAGAPPQNDTMFVDPNRICVLVGTSLFEGAYAPLNVRWCDQEDLTDWVPTPSNLSGDFVLAEGSRAVAGIATRQQNAIFTDTALYTMQFTGDAATVFSFRLAGTGCGLIGALAKAEHNGSVYWMSESNFFGFAGSVPQPIQCPLRRDVFDNLVENQGEKTFAWINPAFSEVSWSYADARDGSECSRYATFSFTENHWTSGTFGRSSWISPGLYEYPIGFGTDGMIYFHEKGMSANGGAIDAWLEAGYFDIGDGENMVHVRRIVPDFEDLQGHVRFDLQGKQWPNSTAMDFGPYIHNVNKTDLPMRMTARQVKARISTLSGPAFWRMGAMRFDVVQGGARR